MNLEDILYNKEMAWFKKKEKTPKGIGQLIAHLKEKNPNLPDSQITRIAHQMQTEPKDASKRKSLQTIAKGAAGLAAMAAFPSLALSQYSRGNNMPPGVTNCKDNALIEAYFLWYRDKYTDSFGDSDKINAMKIMGFDARGYAGTMTLKKDSKFKEPLYHYLVGLMEQERFVNFKELKKKNLPLAYFSGGIQNFDIAFVNNNWRTYNMTKDNAINDSIDYFAKSYVTASGYPETDYTTLIEKINSKTEDEFLINLRKSLTKQSYYNKLTAAWSGFYLSSTFELTQGGDPMDEINNNKIKTKSGFIADNIERPAAKKIGHWIRGPPGRI